MTAGPNDRAGMSDPPVQKTPSMLLAQFSEWVKIGVLTSQFCKEET